MMTIAEIHALISDEIGRLNWNREPIGLYEPIDYTLRLGGKRVRPALTLLAADMFGGEVRQALPAALAVEVFHNFTLLHDDVMDKAEVRRGAPTVHKKWNENTAILSGDVMVIEAYKLLAQVPQNHLATTLKLFSEMACEICEGQQYDMEFESRFDVAAEEYLEMIRLKTAVLLGTSLKMGALIAGASLSDADELYRFGTNIGIAFQLKDDYLDVYGNEATFGKAIGGDILCNKKTYMLICAQQNATGIVKDDLSSWLTKEEYNPATKIAAVTSIYNQLNVGLQCEEMMQKYYHRAVVNLQNIAISDFKKQELRKLAENLMCRIE